MKNKKPIFLLGASILFCFSLFLAPNVSAQTTIPVPDNVGLPDPVDTTGEGPVVQVVMNVLDWILTVFLLLAVIAFVVTGIQYLMAFGNNYNIETAKRNFVYSTIAVAVVGAAMIIIYTIEFLLS